MGDSLIIVTPTADAITDAAGEPIAQIGAQTGGQTHGAPSSAARVYSRNVLISGARIAVFACAGVLLPAFLTHRMPTAVYGAWTLVLQIAGYIGYLEFGIQIAVSKYIAEYATAGDTKGCSQHATAGAFVTLASAVLGLLLSIAFAMLVPRFFPQMPPAIAHDVARGVLLVGASTAFLLVSSPFAGIFLGLQRYAIPTSISIASRLLYAVVLIVMVARHSSLTAMGAAVAMVNVLNAAAQILAWKLLVPQVQVRPALIVWPVVRRVLGYCSVLGVWTAGMLIITGLDTTVVGRVDFRETAFYAIAATPITFLTMTLQAGLNPLMPAASAMSVTHTAAQMGRTLARGTRYAFLILQLTGLPLILFGYGILSVWVGPVYARHGLVLLRILVLAHIVRNLCAPYATMVIATGMQRVATLAGVCEAVVNLVTSVLLGRIYGAIGVAAGTLIGAVVGVAVHFLVSMRRTQGILAISPGRLLRDGVLRPGVSLLPTLVLLPVFWRTGGVPLTPVYVLVWAAVTGSCVWRLGITGEERAGIRPRLLRPLQA